MFSASFRLSESESERILHSKNLDGEIFYLWTLAVRYCTVAEKKLIFQPRLVTSRLFRTPTEATQ